MAFIRAACILVIALVAALFAVENMHEVAIGVFPVASTVSLPVYLIVLAPLAAGLIAGWAFARISGSRARGRRLRREDVRTANRKEAGEGARNRKEYGAASRSLMPVRVKICGIRNRQVLKSAVEGGAAAVGFAFVAGSPREVSPEDAARLAPHVPPAMLKVGLFVDAGDEAIGAAVEASGLDALQLHGSETPERAAEVRWRFGREVWKVLPVAERADVAAAFAFEEAADRLLFDSRPPAGARLPGGNAIAFDWSLLAPPLPKLPWLLSGGLTAGNLEEAVRVSGARMVDVSSGVERNRGQKDPVLVRAFLEKAAAL